MPIRTTRRHRQVLQVLRDNHFSKRESRMFDRSYIADNDYDERFIYPGLIVGLDEVSSYYVPYSYTASYSSYSDTAVGVLHEFYDLTYDTRIVEPVWHGVLIESKCYVYGGDFGDVPDAVKTALTGIVWV